MISLPLCALLLAAPVSALPVLGTAPTFSLIDQGARPVSSRDLAGSVWVADFMFTRCKHECSLLTSRLARVQRNLAGVSGIRYVSFSVDPAHDTPARLARYAREFRADLATWSFLSTKSEAEVNRLAAGMKLASGGKRHSYHYVLIDRGGRIRGYYSQGRTRDLERDARSLAAEGRQRSGRAASARPAGARGNRGTDSERRSR